MNRAGVALLATGLMALAIVVVLRERRPGAQDSVHRAG